MIADSTLSGASAGASELTGQGLHCESTAFRHGLYTEGCAAVGPTRTTATSSAKARPPRTSLSMGSGFRPRRCWSASPHRSNHFTIHPDRTIAAMAYHLRVSCGSPQALTVMPAQRTPGDRVAFPNTRTPRLATSAGNECGRLHRRLCGQQSGRSQRPGNQSVHMLAGGGASNPARAFTPDVGTSGLDAMSLIHPDVVHT